MLLRNDKLPKRGPGEREGWTAMESVARIAFDRGALYLAASTPYERELVLEHVASYARRCRRAHLLLDRRDWLVTAPAKSLSVKCQRCHEEPRWLAYTVGSRTLCQACAREDIKGGCQTGDVPSTERLSRAAYPLATRR
jgi:hypothetical protein